MVCQYAPRKEKGYSVYALLIPGNVVLSLQTLYTQTGIKREQYADR